MTGTISEDALKGQQSRIMDAMKASMSPQQQASPTDLLQALTAQASNQGNYFDIMKKASDARAQNNIAQQTGIYNQMKEQVGRGNNDAAAVDKAITDVSGEDPKIYAAIATQLHADPESVTPANARSKVMKYASEMGINPLSQQESEAKLTSTKAKAAKDQAEANQLNIFNPTQGTPTSNTQQTAIVKENTQPDSASLGNANEEYLTKLPAPVASQVKALAEGRMQFPSGYALKTPYWQQMMQAVSTYDPNFDAVNYNARANTRKDFTSGKSAQNITSLNTAIGHLGALNDAFAGLKNSDYPSYNAVANAIGRQAGNTDIQTAVKDVNTKAIAVAGELAKVFRNTGMSQKEIDDWKDQISPSNSPAENKKVIESAIELMNSRLDAIGEQYNQGMGTTKDPMQLLSPKAQTTYQKLVAPIKAVVEPVSSQSPEIQAQLARKNNANKVIDYTEYFK